MPQEYSPTDKGTNQNKVFIEWFNKNVVIVG